MGRCPAASCRSEPASHSRLAGGTQCLRGMPILHGVGPATCECMQSMSTAHPCFNRLWIESPERKVASRVCVCVCVCACGFAHTQVNRVLDHSCKSSGSSATASRPAALPTSRASWKTFQRLHPLLQHDSQAPTVSVHAGRHGLAGLAATFAENRRAVRPLVLHTLGDPYLGAKLAASALQDSLAERPLQIGDFVPHLTKTNTFCCVWTAPRGGIAEVVDFLVVGRCPKHSSSSAGRCYKMHVGTRTGEPCTYRRAVPPAIQTPPLLTQRPLQKGGLPDAHSRCYQQAMSAAPAPPDADRAAAFRLACDATAASANASEAPVLDGNAQIIFEDATVKLLQYRSMPAACPRSCDSDVACSIRTRGTRFAGKFLCLQGARLVRSVIYECVTHGFRYNLMAPLPLARRSSAMCWVTGLSAARSGHHYGQLFKTAKATGQSRRPYGPVPRPLSCMRCHSTGCEASCLHSVSDRLGTSLAPII